MWVGSADPSEAADRQPPAACVKAINAQLPGWQWSVPPEDLARYAKEKNLPINVAQADFDGDGTRDTAVLLSVPGRGGNKPRQGIIAVCLTRDGSTRTLLIRDPYCSDAIAVAPKGTRHYDYGTEKTVTYWTNGVTGYCFEKASGTYLYRDGRFVLVIDSD
jgi:hypothetical protein